jgi:ligand-binding sensor domain-containing protein
MCCKSSVTRTVINMQISPYNLRPDGCCYEARFVGPLICLSTRTDSVSVDILPEIPRVRFKRASLYFNLRLLLGCLLAAVLPGTASAVAPDRLISQYGHSSWRTEDGFVANPVALTQTKDGYIWIATSDGLMRFDGVKFTPWVPPNGQSLPRTGISYLLGANDGSLWIGTYHGLVRFKGGIITNFGAEPKGAGISKIIEDHTGAIWVTRYFIRDGKGPLCRVTGAILQCFGPKDGMPARYGLGLAEDNVGNIWLGSNILCRWAPGSSSIYFERELKQARYGVTGIAADSTGSVWATSNSIGPNLGVRHYANGKWASYVVPGFNGSEVQSGNLRVDRHQALWVGSDHQGLYRIHDGVADHYGSANGLSGNCVYFVYEDREGNVWVVTDRGIDMFRDTPVVSFSSDEGLLGSGAQSILAVNGNDVWVASDGALDIIHAGRISTITPGHGLPGQVVEAMFQDSTGTIWMGVDDTVLTNKLGHFSEVKQANGSPVRHIGHATAFAEDVERNIWMLTVSDVRNECHLIRFKGGRLQQNITIVSSGGWPHFLAADRYSGVWLNFPSGKLVHYRNGFVENVSLWGEKSGTTYSIFVDRSGALWATTSKGLYRWKDGRLSVMDDKSGLPCSYLFSAVEDNYGSLWIYGKCGLMKVPASDWAAWQKFPERRVSVTTFGLLDGAQRDSENEEQPLIAKTMDGRLWFVSDAFVQMIDPSRSYINTVPPPVYIESIAADHRTYEARQRLSLPPLTGQLEFDYTALSFAVPRRVLFRYKLDGHDQAWQEAGIRRQAFYNDLRPGRYHFRVIACNNDGIWNETGASVDFTIMPAWYQTTWFLLLCVVSCFLTVWISYRARTRQIARAIGAKFDERLAERTRIARDLHDPLECVKIWSSFRSGLAGQPRKVEPPSTRSARQPQKKMIWRQPSGGRWTNVIYRMPWTPHFRWPEPQERCTQLCVMRFTALGTRQSATRVFIRKLPTCRSNLYTRITSR